MPAEFKNAAAATASAAGGSISVSPPANLQKDDLWLIVVVVDVNGTGAEIIGIPPTFTDISATQYANGNSFPAYRAMYKRAVGNETAVTVNFTNGTFFDAWSDSIRIKSQSFSNPIGEVATFTTNADTGTTDAPDLGSIKKGDLVILVLAGNAHASITPPIGALAIDTNADSGFPTSATARIAVQAASYAPGNWTHTNTANDQRVAQTFAINAFAPLRITALGYPKPHISHARQIGAIP